MKPDNATAMAPEPMAAVSAADLEMAVVGPSPNNDEPVVASTKDLADPFLVTFDGPLDPENPKNWSKGKKWAVTDVLSATGFNRIMVSTIMAPALGTIATEFHMNSAESVMAMSIYLLATAFGPLLLGPLSEVYGRRPVLHASNVWFLVWNFACGFAPNKELLIAARFLAGFGASSIYALAGGVLSDVWRPEERGNSPAMYLLIPILGSAVGPIIGGFMAGRTTWRWMFWSTSIFQAVMVAVSFVSFWETYVPVILERRAARLRRETGDDRYYTTIGRRDAKKNVGRVVSRAVSRPLRLLIFHPIIQLLGLIPAFQYGLLYIVQSTFSELWTKQYGQSVEISGLHYIACAIGEIAAAVVGGRLMDYMYHYMQRRLGRAEHSPELRVPLSYPGMVLGPSRCSSTAGPRSATCTRPSWTWGQIQGMPQQAYLMDAYPEHTTSALAATQFLRSLTAFLFPLFAPAMYDALGYGWGNSLLAFVALGFGVPAPLILWRYGKRLREKASSSY
ncbi:caffeine resistance protein [Apiospora hydei]|uniref:Caffeine resistance protein n=1 Tax=Apiospora hydei TaxID=1337664 RepID=A0ABR1VVL7_9PEZI